jgi:hypothetical protein
MSIDLESIDFEDDNWMNIISWAQGSQIWNGREITLEDAPSFQLEVQSRLALLIHEWNLDLEQAQSKLSHLALLGASPENQPFIAREIQSLELNRYGEVVCAGIGSSLNSFWKNHKTEILIGIGILTVVIVVAVVATCSLGAAAAAGSLALSNLNVLDDDKKCLPEQRSASIELEKPKKLISEKELSPNHYSELFDKFKSKEILHPSDLMHNLSKIQSSNNLPIRPSPAPSWNSNFLESIGSDVIHVRKFSSDHFQTVIEPFRPKAGIGGINGMNTSFKEAASHAQYLSDLGGGNEVQWVHNKSNRWDRDLLEIAFLNYLGFSPNTASDLKKNWYEYHELHRDNPKKKYLQFCHSQGTIHVNNALDSCPEEISDRVMVVSIAPAKVVPTEKCFKSYNYASEKDFVFLGEIAYSGFLNSDPFEASPFMEMTIENHEELILLPADPSSYWPDHGWKSLTFVKNIRKHISEYLECDGEYE